VAVMYLGNIMEIGNTEDLFNDPANPYTHSLLSAIPEPDPTSKKDRITLRGTPPNPRDPPSGCPFSTRCPMKIRPEEYEHLDRDVWQAIDVFFEVLRERSRAEPTLRERVRSLVGKDTRLSDIDELVEEILDGIDCPEDVKAHIETAADYAREENESEALEYLEAEFGSVCDFEQPAYYDVDGGRMSLCHRHESGVLDTREHPLVSEESD